MARIMKKGQLGLQFNWIFIMIAGAIILAFFFAVVAKQKDISDQKIAISLGNDIEAIASGAAISRGSVQPIALPKVEIEFSCSDTCDCTFTPGAGISKQFRDNLLFAPGKITGNQIILWTLDWKLPFRIANLVYITNDRVKYFVIGSENSPTYKRLKEKVPEEIDMEFRQDVFSIENRNYEKTKFIFIDEHTPPFPSIIDLDESFEKDDVSAISVSQNLVTFYKKEQKRGYPIQDLTGNSLATKSYIGDESLLAAIFSEDKNMFECNIAKAYKRMSYIASIASQRAGELRTKTQEFEAKGLTCAYASQETNLASLSAQAENAAVVLSQASAASIIALNNQLDIENKQLLQQSCPTIY